MGRAFHGPALHYPRAHIMILERPWDVLLTEHQTRVPRVALPAFPSPVAPSRTKARGLSGRLRTRPLPATRATEGTDPETPIRSYVLTSRISKRRSPLSTCDFASHPHDSLAERGPLKDEGRNCRPGS
jgi:hypothetical protein